MITKEQFLKGVRKAWTKYGYCNHSYFMDANGKTYKKSKTVHSCCAIGGYALVMRRNPSSVLNELEESRSHLAGAVLIASDNAGSPDAALKRLEELKWS